MTDPLARFTIVTSSNVHREWHLFRATFIQEAMKKGVFEWETGVLASWLSAADWAVLFPTIVQADMIPDNPGVLAVGMNASVWKHGRVG